MELDTKQLWENTLTNIELLISPASFKMWFAETHIVRIDDGVVYVGVPNQLTREWVSERFGKLILKTRGRFSWFEWQRPFTKAEASSFRKKFEEKIKEGRVAFEKWQLAEKDRLLAQAEYDITVKVGRKYLAKGVRK